MGKAWGVRDCHPPMEADVAVGMTSQDESGRAEGTVRGRAEVHRSLVVDADDLHRWGVESVADVFLGAACDQSPAGRAESHMEHRVVSPYQLS